MPPTTVRTVAFGLCALLAPGLAGPAAAGRHKTPARFTLKYPGKSWSLVLDLHGLDLQPPEKRPEGTGIMLRGRNRDADLVVSVFMEEADREGDAEVCRKHYLKLAKRSPLPKDDVKLSERDGMALVEYMVSDYGGVTIHQKNLNAYLVRDGVWIGLHVSKRDYTPEDDARLEGVLQSFHFVDPSQ